MMINKFLNYVKTNIEIICFALVLIVALGANIHFAQTKESLFCDEIYSYGLSNSVEYPFLDVESSTAMSENNSGWVTSDYFTNYLVVHEWERTSYKQVWTNQAADTLPPFYYMILHFVCSLFPGIISKWEGLAINFLFFGVALFYLWRLTAKHVDTKYALAACAAWAFSAACINTVTYIRMYAMLACIVLIFLDFFSGIIMQQHRITLYQYVKLILILIAGTLVHYYFLIFVAIIAIQYFIYLLLTKHFRQILVYATAFLIAAVGIVVIFPPITKQFIGYRGTESLNNFFSKANGFIGYYNNLNDTFFGGFLPVIILMLIIITVKTLVEGIQHRSITEKQMSARMICAAVVLYILVVAKIAPFSDREGNRYLYMIYPVIAFLMVYICCYIPKKVRFAVLFSMCLWIGFDTARSENILFQYQDTDILTDIIAKDEGEDCIYRVLV